MHQETISKLSLPELKELKVAVENLIATRQSEAVTQARHQISVIARDIGIPLKDLVGKLPDVEKAKVAVKFRDPADARNQWTGRGRLPHWAAKLKADGTLDSARV